VVAISGGIAHLPREPEIGPGGGVRRGSTEGSDRGRRQHSPGPPPTKGIETHGATIVGGPGEADSEVLSRRIEPQLGPLDDQHASGSGELVVFESERLEGSRSDGALLAETKQIEVHEAGDSVRARSWTRVDHADGIGRTAHALGSSDTQPPGERASQRGLARAHRSAKQDHVAAAKHGAESFSPRAHGGLVEHRFDRADRLLVHGRASVEERLHDCEPRWYASHRMSRAFGSLLVAGLALAACEASIPSFEALPEPEQALRPESQRGRIPEQAHVVDYWIDARLDEHSHEIHGLLRMAWRNRTGRTVDRLPFHLYMNGFRAEDTAWMTAARGRHRGQGFARDRWGFIHVSRVELLDRGPNEPTIALEQTPARPGTPLRHAEDAEPSLMTVTLDQPVGPGESLVLELEFTTRLPRVFARTGYHDDFHMAGQWFPKIGVLEQEAGWQAHEFHLFSEFYADFGDYEVLLDVPAHFVVGATGIRVDEEQLEGERKRLRYRANMVHDFAWVADPDFIEHWGEYEGIRIRQLIQPEHVDTAEAHMQAQIAALASMEARFGPYPWSTITIVHAPKGAEGAGGMEYPTFYTTSDVMNLPVPGWLLRERVSGVFTTVHEFGHQYFQGLFASNEHAQPWLDEGMNTAANQLVYSDAYGEDPWVIELLGQPITTHDLVSLALAETGDRDRIDQPADRFDPLVSSYGAVTYQKTAAVMLTLRELCGHEPWDRAMARYAEAARFGHPTGAMLEGILVETIGGEDGRLALVGDGGPDTVWLDVQDYLDQGLREAGVADFRLIAIGSHRQIGDDGWHRVAEGTPLPAEPPPAMVETERILAGLFGRAPHEGPREWTLELASNDSDIEETDGYVVVQRRSSFRVPVEVLVEFDDGEQTTVVWDGRDEHHRFDFPGRKVKRAIVDPDRKLLIEPHKLDNAAWAKDIREDQGDDPLASWIGDIGEAANLAALGALGI
jgi:hypothetical protein